MTIAELELIREFVLLLMGGTIAIALVWILCAWGLKTRFNYKDRKRAERMAQQMQTYTHIRQEQPHDVVR